MDIDSWQKYKEWIATTVNAGVEFYFRGQRKIDWPLQTSFHRLSPSADVSMDDYLTRVIPEVGYQASLYDNEPINISDSLQFGMLLAKLQHHGFPTPLLDWTLSPYIAAYFAYKDVDPHQPDTDFVAIYMFEYEAWSLAFQQIFDLRDSTEFVSTLRPHAMGNFRMQRQMAATTLSNVSDIGKYITKRGHEVGKSFLFHAALPVSERKLVMNELNLMGINSMTMFPDFDGVCRSMKEKYFNNVDVKLVAVPPAPNLFDGKLT